MIESKANMQHIITLNVLLNLLKTGWIIKRGCREVCISKIHFVYKQMYIKHVSAHHILLIYIFLQVKY